MVQYFAEQLDGFLRDPERLGAVVRQPVCATTDPLRRREPTEADDGRVDHLRAVAHRQAGEGHAHRPRDDPRVVVRARRPAAGRDGSPSGTGDSGRDRRPAVGGYRIIQVDEPALRELLPPRSKDKDAYLRWAVDAFRLSTSGVADSTQIHTHLCYSEFGEVIGAIADLDADVTSIEAARSHMEVLGDLNAVGFSNSVGPGIYDIHSPRVPGGGGADLVAA